MTDVLVIGGGPAGLACAIAARLRGLSVTVAEAGHPPVDKACGEGILPAGVDALRRLGVTFRSKDVFPLRGIRFLDEDVTAEAAFPKGSGLAVRRTCLQAALVARASELGVRLCWNTPLRNMAAPPECRWFVGADGENSQVRRGAGLNAGVTPSVRYGFCTHYRLAPWSDFVEVHWGRRCQVYITPVRDDEIGVAVLSRDSHLRVERALDEFPELRRRLCGVQASTSPRGAVTTWRRLQHVYRGNTALAGDASGSVDAITGAGLSLAFQQALALADALVAEDLPAYQAIHRRLSRTAALRAAGLLLLDRLPLMRHTFLGVFGGTGLRACL